MNSLEQDKNIWKEAIESLDIDGLPEPPPSLVSLSKLPSDEQARLVWESVEVNEFGFKDFLLQQPDFGPNNISLPEQLQPGMVVLFINRDFFYKMIIVSPVQQLTKNEESVGFKYVYWNSWNERNDPKPAYDPQRPYASDQYLVDCGLASHEGTWHPYNHLCFTKEQLSPSELTELQKLVEEDL